MPIVGALGVESLISQDKRKIYLIFRMGKELRCFGGKVTRRRK